MNKALYKVINFLRHPKENYSNFNYFKYHLLKTLGKARNKSASSARDMFDWSFYNTYYRGEMQEARKNYTVSLQDGDYFLNNGKLVKADEKIKPLHPNHRLLYETILELKPASAFELGCGNGMHLHNLKILNKNLVLSAIDREKDQINFLFESYPGLDATVKIFDATKPFPSELFPKVDLTFTQAVIMHIHTGDTHLTALANLFNLSKKYVILMESWKNHRFMDDITELHRAKKINWPEVHFYYKICPETGRPHIMICSAEPIDFPVLNKYEAMLGN